MHITLKQFVAVLSLAASLAVALPGRGADAIRTSDGKTLSGSLSAMSPEEVAIEPVGETIVKRIAVPQIEWIAFDGEPKQLADIRSALRAGQYENVLKGLQRIKLDDVERIEIKQEIAYFRGHALAQLAIAGGGGKNARSEAAKILGELEAAVPQGYRYFDVCESLANLRIAARSRGEAAKRTQAIGAGLLPENKVRAAIISARILLAEGQAEAALAPLDEAQNVSGKSKELNRYRLIAQTIRCLALVELDKADEAVSLASATIASADEDQKELLARAYNALGAAHLKQGKKKEALIDYLHVPLLYASHPEPHAEALARLAVLWVDVYKKNVEAEKAMTELRERYPHSRHLAGVEE